MNVNQVKVMIAFFALSSITLSTSYAAVTGLASNAYRNVGSTQLKQIDESVTYAGKNLPVNYHDVPLIPTDDDGFYIAGNGCTVNCSTVTGVTQAQHDAYVDCGYPSAMTGSNLDPSTIANRINHCALVNPALPTTWDGGTRGNAGQAVWKLVAVQHDPSGKWPIWPNREVWQDQRTGLLWSSRGETFSSWCSGVGSNDPTDSMCSTNNRSACSETLYPNTNVAAVSDFARDNYATGVYDPGKGQMGLKSSPSVRWRLPTRNDYLQAELDGIYAVMPDMGAIKGTNNDLTATILNSDREKAWVYASNAGDLTTLARNHRYRFSVRCVGR